MDDYDGDELAAIRRRRREKAGRKRLMLIVIVAAVGLITLVGVVAAVALSGRGGRASNSISAARGIDTHKELADLLEQKGVKVKVHPQPLGDNANRTVATFEVVGGGERGTVAVWLYRSTDQAREGVGAMGRHSFQYGRFAIGTATESQVPALRSIERALR